MQLTYHSSDVREDPQYLESPEDVDRFLAVGIFFHVFDMH